MADITQQIAQGFDPTIPFARTAGVLQNQQQLQQNQQKINQEQQQLDLLRQQESRVAQQQRFQNVIKIGESLSSIDPSGVSTRNFVSNNLDTLIQASGAGHFGIQIDKQKVIDNGQEYIKDTKELLNLGLKVQENPDNTTVQKDLIDKVEKIESKYGTGASSPIIKQIKEAQAILKAPKDTANIKEYEFWRDQQIAAGEKDKTKLSFDYYLKNIKKAGVSVEVNLEKGTKKTLEQDIIDTQRTIGRVNRIRQLYKPEFLTYAGKAKGFFEKQKDKLRELGFQSDTDFIKAKSAFETAVDAQFFRIRKDITGVAGGEKEMERIEKAFASTANTPSEFEAKLNEIDLWARAVDKWSRETREQGLSIDDTREIIIKEQNDVESRIKYYMSPEGGGLDKATAIEKVLDEQGF